MNAATPTFPTLRRNDLFISYSRRDKEFVSQLDAAFRQVNRDPWIDWEDIPDGEEWRKAIAQGIEGADTFIFVITPDSVASKECGKELDQAIALNKRIIPIVRRETEAVHPILTELNWIFFRESDDFNIAFRKLVKAINTDLGYVQTHTRLLGRAIEWEHGRDDGFLLRGKDLQSAEDWLASPEKKEPIPTEMHRKYIAKSREVAAADQRLAEVGRRAKRIIRISSIVSLVSLASAAVAITAAVYQANRTIEGLNQQTRRLSVEIEARKSQIEGLNLSQERLTKDNGVLIKQLKKFGSTDESIAALLSSSPQEQIYRVEQIKKANDSYHQTVEKLVSAQAQAQTQPTISESPISIAAPSASPIVPPPAAGEEPPQSIKSAESSERMKSKATDSQTAGLTIVGSQAMVQRSSPVTIEYYPKDIDPEAVQKTLTKLGFNLNIKQASVTDAPLNILFYGRNVSEDDVKLVAYTLIRAGVQIKYIQPFTKLADEKASVIQVGALRELAEKPALDVEEIRSQSLPLPR
ncbi:MAG: toll/interleukin-1 receptor domain-containing protein [Leptolyngbyaceae cyanobacterium CSU_1_3]|nr:toll/interleukin-1 receptor domain-containing protein [Leptolyngbyaceae cyanobacterium CSU_1_3]